MVAIKDDTFVLETGADRVKIRFTKNAISSVEKLNMDNAPAKSNFKTSTFSRAFLHTVVQGGAFYV